jgi:beta-galactosidase
VLLDHETGGVTIQAPDGTVLVDGIYPHAGRRFTEAEKLRAKNGSIWTGTFLTSAMPPAMDVSETADGVQVRVRGKYPRPGMPDQSLDGEYRLLVRSDGTIEVSYEYVPTRASGTWLEAGLSLVLPATASEFRWIGQGPFAGYPGKDALNEFGLYHLSRADIRFQGNRRETDAALLTNAQGRGVMLSGDSMDVAVENLPETTVLSQNALISGRGNKGSAPDSPLKADTTKIISGKFTLLPLGTAWPATLTHWFGQPSTPVAVQHPFYRSYDQ